MTATQLASLRRILVNALHEWESLVASYNAYQDTDGVGNDDHPGAFDYEEMFDLVLADTISRIALVYDTP